MHKRPLAILGALAAGAMVLVGCTTDTEGTDDDTTDSTETSAESEEGTGSDSEDIAFPERSIEMVVAWSAGGGTDIQARALVASAEDYLGQSIQVVNKPGSSGAVGWGEIAHSTDPDGYTLTVVSPEIGFMEEQGLYDFGLDDFTLITMFNEDPAALAVKADAPWDTLEEFIADAQANPGDITVGNSGPGLAWDLSTTAVEQAADIEVTHVPYDGAATAVQAVLGGTLDAMTFSIGEVRAQVEAGEMKVLAIAKEERLEALPDIPTFTELGYNVVIGTFRGVAGPAGMDEAVVAKLNDAFMEMAAQPEFVEIMESNSFGINVMSTDEFQAFFEDAATLYEQLLAASAE